MRNCCQRANSLFLRGRAILDYLACGSNSSKTSFRAPVVYFLVVKCWGCQRQEQVRLFVVLFNLIDCLIVKFQNQTGAYGTCVLPDDRKVVTFYGKWRLREMRLNIRFRVSNITQW